MHKKDIGTYGELLVSAQAKKKGMSVFSEVGDNSKVDLILLDDEGNIHKVQIKCYNREKRSPDITLVYFTKSGPNYQYRYNTNDVDWFAVVDNVTDKIAWIPSSLTEENKGISLRHTPTGNEQKKKVRYFDDYMYPF